MSKTLQFQPAPDWNITGTINFTYEGAEPTDKGPAGALLRMFLCQLGQDEAGLKNVVTEQTFSMGKPSAPGKELSVKVKEPQYETEDKLTAVVPADLMVDGQPQELPFIVLNQEGTWKVDMPATMQRLMGGSMELLTNALEEGMKQMAEGMKGVMEGMGEAMSQAFAGGDSPTALSAEPTHPDLIAFRQEMLDRLSIKWEIRADENAFAVCNPELLKDALDSLFAGIMKLSKLPGGIDKLEAVVALEIQKSSTSKDINRLSHTLIYAIGETEDGRADFFDNANVTQALAMALEGIND